MNLIQLSTNDNTNKVSNLLSVSNMTLNELETITTLGGFTRFSIDLIDTNYKGKTSKLTDVVKFLENVFVGIDKILIEDLVL